MPRPTKPKEEQKVRINITLDKSVYKNLKTKGINISGSIEKLLKIAYFNEPALIKNSLSGRKSAVAGISDKTAESLRFLCAPLIRSMDKLIYFSAGL